MRRDVIIIEPPEGYPLEREDAFNMLKFDSSNPALTDEAVFIEDLIAAATDKCEKFTGRCFITQTLRMILTPEIKPLITGGVMTWYSENLGETVPIWRPPCQEVKSIKIVGEDLVEHTVDDGTYNVNVNHEPALVRLNFGAYWPIYLRGWYEIEYVAGYGDTIDKVPPRIRHAVRLTVAQWYASRENLDYTLPTQAVDLLDDYVIDVNEL
jgi:uncharacterized phiE125 gp8 family phage protein